VLDFALNPHQQDLKARPAATYFQRVGTEELFCIAMPEEYGAVRVAAEYLIISNESPHRSSPTEPDRPCLVPADA